MHADISLTSNVYSHVLLDMGEADRRRLVLRWSEYPTWIELHDPLTGDWHEVKASECLPGVLAEADKHREEGGAA